MIRPAFPDKAAPNDIGAITKRANIFLNTAGAEGETHFIYVQSVGVEGKDDVTVQRMPFTSKSYLTEKGLEKLHLMSEED